MLKDHRRYNAAIAGHVIDVTLHLKTCNLLSAVTERSLFAVTIKQKTMNLSAEETSGISSCQFLLQVTPTPLRHI